MALKKGYFIGLMLLLFSLLCVTTYINMSNGFKNPGSKQEAAASNESTKPAAAVKENEAVTLLKKVKEHMQSIKTLHYYIETYKNGLTISQNEVYFKNPTMTLVRPIYPSEGCIIGVNNKELWIKLSEDNKVLAANLTDIKEFKGMNFTNLAVDMQNLEKDYDVSFDKDSNQQIAIIRAKSKYNMTQELLFKVDNQKLLLISQEYHSPEGDMSIEYKNVLVDENIDDSMFEPPVSAERINQPEMLYYLLMKQMEGVGDFSLAEYFNTKAFQLAQDDKEKVFYVVKEGTIRLNSGRYEEALASFTKAQNFNVDNNESTAIHYYKGLSLWHLKRYNEALNEFTNAVNFPESPYYVDSLEAMGRIYFHLGDKIKAVESLKRGLERASYDQRQRIENLITTIDNL